MKDEIIKEVMGMTKEGIMKGIDVLQREVPELVHQIFAWEFTVSIIGIVIGVALLIPIWMSVSKKYRKRISDYVYAKDLEPLHYIGLFLCGLIGFLMTICNLMKALKIIITPKLYLVNYIFGLMKSN